MTKQHGTHDVEVTNNTRAIRWSAGDKEKSIFTNYIVKNYHYMIEENPFVYVECSSVKHATSRFSVRKNVTKKIRKEKNESDTWMD